MKKQTLFIIIAALAIVAIFSISNNKNTGTASNNDPFKDVTNIADITISQADNSDSIFIFSTLGGKMFMMANLEAAEKINDGLLLKGTNLSQLGVGNGFLISDAYGKTFLCTATHCAKGLEKFSTAFGSDISAVDVNSLPNLQQSNEISGGYKVTELKENDSIFVKGYLPDRLGGKTHWVTIKGLAVVKDKGSIEESTVIVKDSAFSGKSIGIQNVQQRTANLKMEKNIDLGGLSGAPVFNKKGEVVGVFAGRTYMVSGTDTTYYLRASLFF